MAHEFANFALITIEQLHPLHKLYNIAQYLAN